MDFVKMHGLGNDFLMLEAQSGIDYAALAQRLCPRHTAVGADGIIVIEKSDVADIRMRIFNADGSEAEMCGNGIRCFAKYVYEKGIVKQTEMAVETLAGIIRPQLFLDGETVRLVRVNMGKPSFEPEKIPVLAKDPMDIFAETELYPVYLSSVLMGVPHTIMLVDELEKVQTELLGELIERLPIFPKKTNVDFVQIVDENTIKMDTWERGAGHTLACGTGATAGAIICYKKELTMASVDVLLAEGTLHIDIEEDGTAFMTGPAAYSFNGTVD